MNRTATIEEWRAEAARRFGPDPLKWRFVCPACGHIASTQDWKDAGAPSTTVAFSCVGRWLKNSAEAFSRRGKKPCNYAGGGLIRLNPVTVTFPDGTITQAFEFAPEATT